MLFFLSVVVARTFPRLPGNVSVMCSCDSKWHGSRFLEDLEVERNYKMLAHLIMCINMHTLQKALVLIRTAVHIGSEHVCLKVWLDCGRHIELFLAFFLCWSLAKHMVAQQALNTAWTARKALVLLQAQVMWFKNCTRDRNVHPSFSMGSSLCSLSHG